MRELALPLCKLLKALLVMSYVRNCCQEARVVFIPKAGRARLGPGLPVFAISRQIGAFPLSLATKFLNLAMAFFWRFYEDVVGEIGEFLF